MSRFILIELLLVQSFGLQSETKQVKMQQNAHIPHVSHLPPQIMIPQLLLLSGILRIRGQAQVTVTLRGFHVFLSPNVTREV